MDSFEINKIIAAVLLTALLVIGIGKFADVLFHVDKPKQSAYKVEGLEIVTSSTTQEKAKIEEKVDIAKLLAMGDDSTQGSNDGQANDLENTSSDSPGSSEEE